MSRGVRIHEFGGPEVLKIEEATIHPLNADFLFEIPDLPTERRLGSAELLLGGYGQTACVGDGDELAEMPEFHHNLPCFASMGPAYKVFFKPTSDLYSENHCTRGLPGRQSVSPPGSIYPAWREPARGHLLEPCACAKSSKRRWCSCW